MLFPNFSVSILETLTKSESSCAYGRNLFHACKHNN
nr:MAG TPA_asm: hypothetical protein [Bacteriophage sp.]